MRSFMFKVGLYIVPVLFLLAIASSVFAWTLYWAPVGTYTDNTLIEPERTVMYNVELDGTIVSSQQTAVEWPIPDDAVGHSKDLTFRLQTELDTGVKSAWTSPFVWRSEDGVPVAPSQGGMGVKK